MEIVDKDIFSTIIRLNTITSVQCDTKYDLIKLFHKYTWQIQEITWVESKDGYKNDLLLRYMKNVIL
jgi:hypothetical protein